MHLYGYIQSYALVPDMKPYQPPSLTAKAEKQKNKFKLFFFFNMIEVIVIEKNLPPTHLP